MFGVMIYPHLYAKNTVDLLTSTEFLRGGVRDKALELILKLSARPLLLSSEFEHVVEGITGCYGVNR